MTPLSPARELSGRSYLLLPERTNTVLVLVSSLNESQRHFPLGQSLAEFVTAPMSLHSVYYYLHLCI